jgi:hypothetical protein
MTVVVFMAEDEVEVLFFALGADDVGPPRALEDAVADAYEPAARRLLRCCFDDLALTLFSLEEEVEAWADSESLPLDDDEEEEPLLLLLLSPLFDDDDRGMVTAASLRILLILLPVFILSMVLAVVVISVVAMLLFCLCLL